MSALTVHGLAKRRKVRPAKSSMEPQLSHLSTHQCLNSGGTFAPANLGTHQTAHMASGGPVFHNKQGKECFDPDSKHLIHRPVSRFSCVQSTSVCGKGESLPCLSGTFLQGGDAEVQNRVAFSITPKRRTLCRIQ